MKNQQGAGQNSLLQQIRNFARCVDGENVEKCIASHSDKGAANAKRANRRNNPQ